MGSSLSEWKKKFWQERESNTSVSNHWLRETLFTRNYSRLDYTDDQWDDERNEPTKVPDRWDFFSLAKYQRAIGNFVYILTQRSTIKVEFATDGRNYTDGKTVVLSPDIKADKFDVAVGLALHEASHILYTRFSTLPRWIEETADAIKSAYPLLGANEPNRSEFIRSFVKTILNIVEDRYIDARTYEAAPGYRGYYSALYREYFGSEIISKAFNAPELQTPLASNYIFHVANMANPDRNNNALPGLDTIITLINLPTILRLKTPRHRYNVAELVIDIIADECSKYLQSNPPPTPGESASDDIVVIDEETGRASPVIEVDDLIMSADERKELRGIIENQKKLINNEILNDIPKITGNDSVMINDIVNAGVNIVNVKDTELGITSDVYVINNITRSIVGSSLGKSIGITSKHRYGAFVESGIRKGRILANKLKLRVDEHSLTSTRLKAGRIDNRLLAEIGFNNYEIFKKIDIESYTPSFIHVSIDASGSMGGTPWTRCIELASALATMSTLVPNVRVVISSRSTMNRDRPYIVTVFDSERHGLPQIRGILPYMDTVGSTPEGLCFAAILDSIIKKAMNTDAYFINLCDGQPTYPRGEEHTEAQRKILEKHGVKVLAYFISSSYYYAKDNVPGFFSKMYGKKNSFRVASADIVAIAKTMNQKLLEK